MSKAKQFWEFAIRSMRRRLGIEITGRLFLANPVKSIQGSLKYRHYLSKKALPKVSLEKIFLSRPLFIGAYCQKPPDCPTRRFSHQCLFAESLTTHCSCKDCELKQMAELAMTLKCPFYIMTTALDVLLDVFLREKFPFFLVMICNYAKEFFILPALVFDMKGYFLSLGKGGCRNYQEFLSADKGHKPNQTFLSPIAHRTFMKLRNQIMINPSHYQKFILKENFYIPPDS